MAKEVLAKSSSNPPHFSLKSSTTLYASCNDDLEDECEGRVNDDEDASLTFIKTLRVRLLLVLVFS